MKNKKIINDPVHGFITVPFESLLQLIEHPYVQRLRRIKQLGMTDYVYPGAVHTRFHHALGAMHLMMEALTILKSKNVEITDEEAEAACAAILLHDIGHGPFSHALEHLIVPLHHEEIGLALMQRINQEWRGKLDRTLEIYQGLYEKPFLHQLVSGQLDMDRMDYLSRDSFFTGVTEGLIGHSRLIKMLNVVDGNLVVEEKGLHSIEKFLHARHFMYWQVYLHKTVLSTEIMLQRLFARMKQIFQPEDETGWGRNLSACLRLPTELGAQPWLDAFVNMDDTDILYALKNMKEHPDSLVRLLSLGLLERRLFKLTLQKSREESDRFRLDRLKMVTNPNNKHLENLIVSGSEKSSFYCLGEEEIKILTKGGSVKNLSDMIPIFGTGETEMHYVSYPSTELLNHFVHNQ